MCNPYTIWSDSLCVSYISVLLSREEFFEKIRRRSNSEDSERSARSAITNLEFYCKDVYGKSADQVAADIKEDLEISKDIGKTLKFLDDFVKWLQKDHPNIELVIKNRKGGRTKKAVRAKTVDNYVIYSRKYMKLCHGIKIDDDDFKDFVVIPPDDDEEEAEPFSHEELRIIIDNTPSQRRKSMYMVMKDTASRIKATVMLRKQDFDLTKDPATVTFRKASMKGKKRTVHKMISRETLPGLRLVLSKLDDEDLAFGTNQDPKKARDNEEVHWSRLVKRLGYAQKYANGRLKKNIHSIKAFTETQVKEATKDKDFADAYGDHERYLQQYIRIPDERKIQLFRQAEPRLSLYETTIVVDNDERIQTLENKLENYKMLDTLLEEMGTTGLVELIKQSKTKSR